MKFTISTDWYVPFHIFYGRYSQIINEWIQLYINTNTQHKHIHTEYWKKK